MKRFVFSILAGVGALALIGPQVRADEWNKKTEFTFSQPVEVPGQVLPAGSYVFKLADSQVNRHIVQVFNERENHLYGTFLTVPAYRAETPDKPVITFEERAGDAPQAVKSWFYPGDNYGDQFIYHKPVEMASVTQSANPAMPSSTSNEETTARAETENQQPAVAATPETQPAVTEPEPTQELAQANPPAPAVTPAPETTPSETAPSENPPEQLPKTGSELPLIGLIGFLSLGAGWSLRTAARRIG